MKLIILILSFTLVACGKPKDDPIIEDLEAYRECIAQPGAQQITFPDGTSRKTFPYVCKDGCTLYVDSTNAASTARFCL